MVRNISAIITSPINTLLIRGTCADENGNISTRQEAMVLEVLPAVMATKRWGGKVICQVERIVKNGVIGAKEVTVPGVLVDAVVVCENPFEDHRQTFSWHHDPTYSGEALAPESAIEPLPNDVRKIISRRAAAELIPNQIINIGTGIPNEQLRPHHCGRGAERHCDNYGRVRCLWRRSGWNH